MMTHNGFWNPTEVAAAKNESYAWPPNLQTSISNGPNHAGEVMHVQLGGQAPMFIHADISDPGLVRLGGQSPLF